MLLFLTSINDQFLALDGAGAPLPLATLRFYVSGTNAQAQVYSDPELETEIDQPVTADEVGEFELIYLDPTVDYRAILQRADGSLVWDVDPYEIDDSQAGRNLLRGPKVQALDGDELPISGATMEFFTSGTDDKVDVFADAVLETPHQNPIMADASGFFAPVYVTGSIKVVTSWMGTIDEYPPPLELTAWDCPVASLGLNQFGNTNIVPVSGDNEPTNGSYSQNTTNIFRLAFANNTFRDAFLAELTGRQLSIETSGAPVIYDVGDAVAGVSRVDFSMSSDIWTAADVGQTYRVQIEEI